MFKGSRLAVFVLSITLVLAGCGGGGGADPAGAGSASPAISSSAGSTGNTGNGSTPPVSRGTTITFLQINDLHAHLTPHQDRVPDGRGGTRVVERGGLARLATLVGQQRAAYPDSVLMNIGDTYHGGAEALFTLGNAIVDPVNALGIDLGVPGNWDFGYSSIVFRLRYTDETPGMLASVVDPLRPSFAAIKKPDFPNLAANLTRRSDGSLVLPATMTKNIAGVQVGFIGITSDIVKHVYPLLAPSFDFVGEDDEPAVAQRKYRELVEKYAAELRQAGAEVVVVMSELGIHKDKRLADIVTPGSVDVFFSAHTHEATYTPLQSASGALVVEAGNDGYLGRMHITVENGMVTDRQWTLLEVDRTLAADAEMQALVDRARAPFMKFDVDVRDPMPNSLLALVQPLDTVIATTDEPLDRRNALESTFNNAVTSILKQYSGADIAMAPGFRFDSVIARDAILEDNTVASGDITLEDVYRFYPLMFGISTGDVSGRRLREIIETALTTTYSKEPFAHRGGWIEGFAGLGVTASLGAADGHRVVDMYLTDSGQPITDDMTLRVVGCKRPIEARDLLCTYPGFSNVFPLINSGTGAPWTIIDLLVEGLQDGILLNAGRHDFVDLDDAPAWPVADFVQPLQ